MPSYDLFTLGETMLRLAAPSPLRLAQNEQLTFSVGGAESNVAANLARLGKRVAWHSRLPNNPLGGAVAGELRRHGVLLDTLIWAEGERLGLYFVDYGHGVRPTQVWYDRADSAASRMTPQDLPFEAIAGARWLHLTGITPALSANCAETVQVAAAYAREHGLSISFDVNYRAKLWSPQQAAETLSPLCEVADYTFLAARDASGLWGIEGTGATIAQDLQTRWGGVVIVTQGEIGVAAFDGQDLSEAPAIPTQILDRIGAGDAFVSGVLCRLLESASLPDALKFGAALAALKLNIWGDIALVTRAEVEALLSQNSNELNR